MRGVDSIARSHLADWFPVANAHCFFLHVCDPQLYSGKMQSLQRFDLREGGKGVITTR